MYLKHALLSAILFLAISFCISQLIVTRRYASISVTIHFNSSLRFTNVDVETTYSYTNESTVFAFNYTEATSVTESETVTKSEYETFTIMLNGTSIYRWFSIPLKIQSGGYVQHVFFNVNFGTYIVTATVEHFEWIVGVVEEEVAYTISILDERKLEFTV